MRHIASTSPQPQKQRGFERPVALAPGLLLGHGKVPPATIAEPRSHGVDFVAEPTFSKYERAGFRRRGLDPSLVHKPPLDPAPGSTRQKQRPVAEPVFNGFTHSTHAVNGPHKENTTEMELKSRVGNITYRYGSLLTCGINCLCCDVSRASDDCWAISFWS